MKNPCCWIASGTVLIGVSSLLSAPRTDFAEPPPAVADKKAPSVVDQLKSDAAKLRPLMKSDAGRTFLDAAKALPEPSPRTVYRSADKSRAFSESEYQALPEAERAGLTPRVFDPEFYYSTGYGSPLISSRAFDVAAGAAKWGDFRGKRILDFGYGSIGQGRLLALLGADYTGVEVEPVLRALYAQPGDTGAIAPADGKGDPGKLTLLNGRWPAEKPITDAAGEGYDLFISKNTLKRGYIHPAREVDPKYLVKLGVDDETFLKNMHRVLKPGGLAIIYNISPAQNPAEGGKPYLPHADGQCPFDRAQLEKAGFEIVEFDKPDTEAALDIWMALGINGEKTREEQGKDLFAWHTLVRKR